MTAPPPVEPTELVLLSEHLSHSPVSAEQIREQTAPVVQFLKQGWPNTMDKAPHSYPFSRGKRSYHCLKDASYGARMCGHSECIPRSHSSRTARRSPWNCQVKSLARPYIWWPGITGDIEAAIHLCPECQLHQASPAQLHYFVELAFSPLGTITPGLCRTSARKDVFVFN